MSTTNLNIVANAQGVSQTATALDQVGTALAKVESAGKNGGAAAPRTDFDILDRKIRQVTESLRALQEQATKASAPSNIQEQISSKMARLDRLNKLRFSGDLSGGVKGAGDPSASAKGIKDAVTSASGVYERQLELLRGLKVAYSEAGAAASTFARELAKVAALKTDNLKDLASAASSSAKAMQQLANLSRGQAKINAPGQAQRGQQSIGQTINNLSGGNQRLQESVNKLSNAYVTFNIHLTQTLMLLKQISKVAPPAPPRIPGAGRTGGGGGGGGGGGSGRTPTNAIDRFIGTNAPGSQGFFGGLSVVGIAKTAEALLETEKAFQRVENTLKVAVGPAQVANEMAYAKKTADALGLSLLDTASGYSKIAAAGSMSGLSVEQTRKIFVGVSTASAAMGLSADNTARAMKAFEQMVSKGKIGAEELRGQLGDAGIAGASKLAADALGVTTAELEKLLEKGETGGLEGIIKFADKLTEAFSGGINLNGLQSQLNRLTSNLDEAKRAISAGGFADTAAGVIKAGANPLLEAVKGFDFKKVFAPLIASSDKLAAIFTGIAGAGVVSAFMAMGAVVTALTAGPFGLLGVAATALVGSITTAVAMTKDGYQFIVDTLGDAAKYITTGFKLIVEDLAAALGGEGGGAREKFRAIVAEAANVVIALGRLSAYIISIVGDGDKNAPKTLKEVADKAADAAGIVGKNNPNGADPDIVNVAEYFGRGILGTIRLGWAKTREQLFGNQEAAIAEEQGRQIDRKLAETIAGIPEAVKKAADAAAAAAARTIKDKAAAEAKKEFDTLKATFLGPLPEKQTERESLERRRKELEDAAAPTTQEGLGKYAEKLDKYLEDMSSYNRKVTIATEKITKLEGVRATLEGSATAAQGRLQSLNETQLPSSFRLGQLIQYGDNAAISSNRRELEQERLKNHQKAVESTLKSIDKASKDTAKALDQAVKNKALIIA